MDPTQIGTLAVTGIVSAGATVGLMRYIFSSQKEKIEALEQKKVDASSCLDRCDRLTGEVEKVNKTLHGSDGASGLVKSIHYIESAIQRAEKNGGSFSGE